MAVSYGAETSVTVTSWNSLAAAARAGSSSVDNTSNLYHAATLNIALETNGSVAPTAGDYVEVWLEGSTDGGTTFGTDQGVLLGTVAQPTTTSTVFQCFFETDQVLAVLPPNWRITIVNRGAQALNAAGNVLKYRGKKAA